MGFNSGFKGLILRVEVKEHTTSAARYVLQHS